MIPEFQISRSNGNSTNPAGEVNTTNRGGAISGSRMETSRSRGTSSSSISSSSGLAGSESDRSSTRPKVDGGRATRQPESLEELQRKLGLIRKPPTGAEGSHTTGRPASQLTLRRIRLEDESLADTGSGMLSEVPIDTFGQKILIEMGMGDPTRDIGIDKRPTEPILFVPRPEGMGIGAVSKQELMKKIRNGQEVTHRDLQARHTEHVIGIQRNAPPENPRTCTLRYGETVTIIEGKYVGLQGKVVGGEGVLLEGQQPPAGEDLITEDELGARQVIVQLTINQKNIKFLRKNLEKGVAELPNPTQATAADQADSKKKKHKWVKPDIRCRIVSQKYRQGKYMDRLGRILDVPDCYTVQFQTDDGQILDDIEEKHLETVMPLLGEKVMIVKGPHSMTVGTLNERKKKENKVVIKIILPDGGIDHLHLSQDDCSALSTSKVKTEL